MGMGIMHCEAQLLRRLETQNETSACKMKICVKQWWLKVFQTSSECSIIIWMTCCNKSAEVSYIIISMKITGHKQADTQILTFDLL